MPGLRPKYNVFSKAFHDQVLSKYEEDTKELVAMYPEAVIYLDRVAEDDEAAGEQDDNSSWEMQVELVLEKLINAK